MARVIYEDGNFIWKYVFAIQPSEQYRISLEYGIGKLFYNIDMTTTDENDNLTIDENGTVHFETKHVPYLIPYEDRDNYNGIAYGDTLHLKYDDINSLKNICTSTVNYPEAKKIEKEFWKDKESATADEVQAMESKVLELCPDYYFAKMVETMAKYMSENPKDDYYFDGEF